jgi:DNA-binding transcriptional ArsR family regulator
MRRLIEVACDVQRRGRQACAAPLDTSSKHLKVLERAGLVRRGRMAQLRPSRLHGQALGEAAAWLADYRAFWDDSFDRLDEHLGALKRQADA